MASRISLNFIDLRLPLQLLKEFALLQSLQQGINSLPARLTLALTAVRNTLRYGVINFRCVCCSLRQKPVSIASYTQLDKALIL